MSADAFASKAQEYARYRADYPASVIDWVADRAGVCPAHTMVELGSGTGLLARHLLDRVGLLYAVEPSADMRRVAEETFGASTRFGGTQPATVEG